MLLVNLPLSGVMAEPDGKLIGGLLHYLYQGNKLGIFPPLIFFMGVGVMTDFGPLLANPKSFLLGAAAQFGIFFAFFLVLSFLDLHQRKRHLLVLLVVQMDLQLSLQRLSWLVIY